MYSKNRDQLGPFREYISLFPLTSIAVPGTAGIRDLGPIPFPAALDAERYGAEQRTHYYHGMQPDEPSLEETADSEGLLPSVIVCVAYHESRQDIEEVHCEISVVDALVDGRSGESLADMVEYDQQGGYASEAVEKFVMGL